MFRYFAPHVERARSLTILGRHHTDLHAACFLLRTPSPTLQHLEVCTDGSTIHLPDDFLSRQAPSFRSIGFDTVHPAFESRCPLPSLIEFELSLSEGIGLCHVDALFQFFSGCPQLRKICFNSPEIARDITLDQVASLESLVELDYSCDTVG